MLLANYATVVVARATLNTGRSRRMGLIALFVGVGSWSWLDESKSPVSVLRRKTCGLVALLAAALSWASIQGFPKGSGQGSRATAAISIFPLVSLHAIALCMANPYYCSGGLVSASLCSAKIKPALIE